MAVKVIKDVMRNAYKAYRHKLRLAYIKAGGDGFAGSDGHLEALAHPPKDFPNKHDWAHMCEHFTTDAFKVYLFAYCLHMMFFLSHGSGQLGMICGTGKHYTSYLFFFVLKLHFIIGLKTRMHCQGHSYTAELIFCKPLLSFLVVFFV